MRRIGLSPLAVYYEIHHDRKKPFFVLDRQCRMRLFPMGRHQKGVVPLIEWEGRYQHYHYYLELVPFYAPVHLAVLYRAVLVFYGYREDPTVQRYIAQIMEAPFVGAIHHDGLLEALDWLCAFTALYEDEWRLWE